MTKSPKWIKSSLYNRVYEEIEFRRTFFNINLSFESPAFAARIKRVQERIQSFLEALILASRSGRTWRVALD